MTVYLDLIFFMNFFYDLLIILTVSITLKRKKKFYRHLISAFIGALSIFLLFLNINSTILFILKVLVSILMCIISFGFVSFRYTFNNILYLYMVSAILAGFLYFVDYEVSHDNIGIIFFYNGNNPNYILLLILSPIILGFYIYSSKKLKNTYSLYYNIEIYFDSICIKCLALFDNGNSLKDPITRKSIIIVNRKKLSKIVNIRSPVYVPYQTVSGSSLMKCYKPSYIIINNKKIYNYLIGESNYRFSDGVDCLLNVKLMEDNYV